jgi:hypothetical protein
VLGKIAAPVGFIDGFKPLVHGFNLTYLFLQFWLVKFIATNRT